MVSRWADTEDDAAAESQRKREKEEKKRAKADKQRRIEEEARREQAAQQQQQQQQAAEADDASPRPTKRRRLSTDEQNVKTESESQARPLLRFSIPSWQPSRTIERFERLNHIEEGTYGFVSRARDIATGEIVAIKKMKTDYAGTSGIPVTALREILTLNAAKHRHIVALKEVVTGDDSDDVPINTRNSVAPPAPTDIFLVMEFLEHDLKTLMEDMPEPWLPSEVKTLMLQLASALDFLHAGCWILHRDLKTSNVLMNNRGQLKLADFGMARFTSHPPPANLTSLVTTLWYRAPELLLGATEYDAAVDMWSLGCIFGELLTKEPLLQGKNEVDQLARTFDLCGPPTEHSWPGFRRLPNARSLRLPPQRSNGTAPPPSSNAIRAKFPFLTNAGTTLLVGLLLLDPAKRPSASEVLTHAYFAEDPRPKSTAMFPTFPSKAGQERRRRHETPNAPVRGQEGGVGGGGEVDFSSIFAGRGEEEQGAGFHLRMG